MFPPGIEKSVEQLPIEKQVHFWKRQLFYSALSTVGCLGISLFTVFNMHSGRTLDVTSKVDDLTDAYYAQYEEHRKKNPGPEISKHQMREAISDRAEKIETGILLVCAGFTGFSAFGTRRRLKLLREAKSKLPHPQQPDIHP